MDMIIHYDIAVEPIALMLKVLQGGGDQASLGLG